MSQSNSEKYNDCNPRDDSYCIFEKQYKELKEKYDLEFTNGKGVELGLLQRENKRLQSYFEKYCILQEYNDEMTHEFQDFKEQIDKIKKEFEHGLPTSLGGCAESMVKIERILSESNTKSNIGKLES